jgi:glutamyl-tRNA reductase
MPLSLLSFSYKTTPLALREKLAVPASCIRPVLTEARERCGLDELMLLSTCNRVEYYFLADDGEAAARALLDWIKTSNAGWDEALEQGALALHDEAALTHVFRVACSLESMVIGEPQILGQVKEGYRYAHESRALGPYLNGLLQRVFHAAKRVRSETGIARYPVSVSYVAAELAGRIFDSLEDKTVLVVGAGEMAELVVTHLQKVGVQRLLITNRTFANAVALAERVQGSAVRFEQLGEHLAVADIVIASTGAPGYIIHAEPVRQAVRARKGRPMFLIDIAVPRDVDPGVNELADVYCYDIDDLQTVADANHRERQNEARAAQRIVAEEVERFGRLRERDAVTPALIALRRHFAQTGERELERTLGRLGHLPERDARALRALVQGLLNKLLHGPSLRLKALGEEQNGQLYAEALRELFALDDAAHGASANPSVADFGVVDSSVADSAAAGLADPPTERPGAAGREPNVVPFRATGPTRA